MSGRPRSRNGINVYEEGWTRCRTCSKWIIKTSNELRPAKSKALIHDECGKQVTMRPTNAVTRRRSLEARGVKWID